MKFIQWFLSIACLMSAPAALAQSKSLKNAKAKLTQVFQQSFNNDVQIKPGTPINFGPWKDEESSIKKYVENNDTYPSKNIISYFNDLHQLNIELMARVQGASVARTKVQALSMLNDKLKEMQNKLKEFRASKVTSHKKGDALELLIEFDKYLIQLYQRLELR